MKNQVGFRNDGERRGAAYLASLGHQIIKCNYVTPDRGTEIDLITVCGAVLHFVEVKAWQRGLRHPLESQNGRRQDRVRRAARIFLAQNGADRRRCTDPVMELCQEGDALYRVEGVSFDLLWVRDSDCEFFERIF